MIGKGNGIIFIISAPSGGGKTTLVRKVMETLPNLTFSVSYTTRSPRANERDGEDYHFISHARFQEMVEEGEFLEWAEVLGNRYGTAKTDLHASESEGVDLILDIDPQGARKVMEKIDHPVLIYLLPPSLQALQERLVRRGLDSPEMIRFRLANAKKDIQQAHRYQYLIVNDIIEDAVEQLRAIILAERCRKENKGILEKNKKTWEENHGSDYSGGLS